MNLKILRNNYEKLSSLERNQLCLDAIKRNDDQELQALVRTCPVFLSRIGDPNFWELHDASQVFAFFFALKFFELKHDVEKARRADAAFYLAGSAFEQGCDFALRTGGTTLSEGFSFGEEYHEKLAYYQKLRDQAKADERRSSARVKGLHLGFVQFCQSVGLDPGQLLAWCPGLFEEMEAFLKSIPPDFELDAGMAETIFERLSSQWPELHTKTFSAKTNGGRRA